MNHQNFKVEPNRINELDASWDHKFKVDQLIYTIKMSICNVTDRNSKYQIIFIYMKNLRPTKTKHDRSMIEEEEILPEEN